MASAKEIPPGGEGKIDVTFKVGSRAGTKKKTITVTTNDPGQSTVALTVKADVEVVLALSPSRLNFGRVKKGQELVRYVDLTGTAKDSVTITSAKGRNPNIIVEADSAGFQNNADKKIRVTIKPEISIGRVNDRVIIETDHDSVKNLTLYVYGEVTGNILVQPTYLSFGMMQKGRRTEKTVTLRASGDTTFNILDVTSSIPELTTQVQTVTKGKEYRIKAVVDETNTKDLLKGVLNINTDDSEQRLIRVKVFGRMVKQTRERKAPPKS